MKRLALLLLVAPATALADGDPSLLGATLRTRPAYDGSRSQVTDVVPIVSWYGKALFVRSTDGVLEGGARAEVAKGVTLGAQAAYEPGPRSVDPGASLGAHLEVDGKVGPAPVTFLARLRERFAHERQTQLDLRLTVGLYQSGPLSAGAYVQTTWSSASWNRDYYLVNNSGLLITDLGLIGGYDLSAKWVALGSVEFGRLGGFVAGSPWVQQRSTFYATAALAYKF